MTVPSRNRKAFILVATVLSCAAIALSIGNVFRRSWWPYQTVLGRVAGIPGFHDLRSYPTAEHLPGCVIFRFDAPLFFANARLAQYGIILWVTFHVFVTLYEEPTLRRQFGADYDAFRSHVPRWIPRLKPWRP